MNIRSVWGGDANVWLKEQIKQEVEPSSTGSTLSSTSQRDRVKRLIPNMRWGSLRQLPRRRPSVKLQSGAATSLKPHLTNRDASEWFWPTASLELEKPSRCRSSLWTGQRAPKTKMSVCWFCCRSGSWTWSEMSSTVFSGCSMFSIQHYRRWQQRSSLSVNFSSSLTAWMKADFHWISTTMRSCLMSHRSHQSACCWQTSSRGSCFPRLSSGSLPDLQRPIRSLLHVSTG